MADPTWVDGSTPLNAANMTKLQTRDEKGQPNGYASLDASGAVSASQLPTAAVSVPTGAALDFFGVTAPAGFLLCDGSAVSRAAYAALFGVIGVSYGAGDGASTFNLPDTRGRVLVGASPGGNAEVSTLGANDGTAQPARRVRHAHTNGLTAAHNLTLPDHAHAASTDAMKRIDPTFSGNQQITQANEHGDLVAANVSVGSVTSAPGINGGVTVAGSIGVAGGTADGPSYLVCNRIIKT